MEKIRINNINKSYGEKIILDIKEIIVNSGEKVGIVGPNGIGKTSLLKIIYESSKYNTAYISQLEEPMDKYLDGKLASILNVGNVYHSNMSGGERTKFKIGKAIEDNKQVLLLDEPTSNLDMESIEILSKLIEENIDSFLLVSHNRDFLERHCNQIWEIQNGEIIKYNGRYSDYLKIKDLNIKTEKQRYESYIKEKRRIVNIKKDIAEKSNSIRKTPSRMGNSEARLHKMGDQRSRKNLDSRVNAMDTRLDHLEIVDKIKEQESIKLTIPESSKIYSKVILSGKNICKGFNESIIFNKANFTVNNHKKIGLIGENGSGKSTLIEMIIKGESIKKYEKLKIGYFSQSLDILKLEKTILENVMETSVYDESFSRIFLGRMLFKADDVNKTIDVLSGGERVKVSLVKVILSDHNFLILDEPTNYLDISSLEVLEDTLLGYEGGLLIVSHDKSFIKNIADELLIIENKKIKAFKGTYDEYIESKNKVNRNMDYKKIQEKKMILEMEISNILSNLSIEENEEKKRKLDDLYIEKLKLLKDL